MIAIATNIYEFTNWLKYGTRTVSKHMLIDLSDTNQNSELLLEKLGLFEEDFEIFFCVLNETFLYSTDTIFPATSHQLWWCIDSFVLRKPPLRQAPKRYRLPYERQCNDSTD